MCNTAMLSQLVLAAILGAAMPHSAMASCMSWAGPCIGAQAGWIKGGVGECGTPERERQRAMHALFSLRCLSAGSGASFLR